MMNINYDPAGDKDVHDDDEEKRERCGNLKLYVQLLTFTEMRMHSKERNNQNVRKTLNV